jgi:hypothetical protein
MSEKEAEKEGRNERTKKSILFHGLFRYIGAGAVIVITRKARQAVKIELDIASNLPAEVISASASVVFIPSSVINMTQSRSKAKQIRSGQVRSEPEQITTEGPF